MTPTTPAVSDALKPFAAKAEYCDALELADDDYADCAPLKAGDYRRARAALDDPSPPVKGDSGELVERLLEGAATIKETEPRWLNAYNIVEAYRDAAARITALSERVVVLEGERDGYMAALRWVYENGLPHDCERPDFVNRAFSDAFAPVRAALKGCDALGGAK